MTEKPTDAMLDGIFAHARGRASRPDATEVRITLSPANEYQAIQEATGVGGAVARTPSGAIANLYRQLVKNETEALERAEVALGRLGAAVRLASLSGGGSDG